jgi:hypothetical protein
VPASLRAFVCWPCSEKRVQPVRRFLTAPCTARANVVRAARWLWTAAQRRRTVLPGIRRQRQSAAAYRLCGRCPATRKKLGKYLVSIDNPQEYFMPIILWLLGVPLTVIVLLMLFHVL